MVFSRRKEVDVNYSIPKEATGINCPNCGVGQIRGRIMCDYCGSGIDSRGGFDIEKLRAIATELNWETDFEKQHRLDGMVAEMKEMSDDSGESFFSIFNEVPVLVGPDISKEETIENFHLGQKLKRRDELGDIWYTALVRFHEMQDKFALLDPDSREAVMDKFFSYYDWGRHNNNMSNSFFGKPTFDLMEKLMSNYGGSDADDLSECVEEIVRAMDDLKL